MMIISLLILVLTGAFYNNVAEDIEGINGNEGAIYSNIAEKIEEIDVDPKGALYSNAAGKVEEITVDSKRNCSNHTIKIDNITKISYNKIIGVLCAMRKEYIVHFDVFITGYTRRCGNILHLTVGGDAGNGNRIPGIWICGQYVYISSAVNGNGNYAWSDRPHVELNEWITVHISQTLADTGYAYQILINGRLKFYTLNREPQEFENVKVYMSDPWYQPQPGTIRNLSITTK